MIVVVVVVVLVLVGVGGFGLPWWWFSMTLVVLDGGGCFVLYWFLDDASDGFGDKLGWWW